MRPFNVYGPGQIGGGAIRAFIEAALAGNDLTVRGDGAQIRAWCFVDDMVEAVLLCLEHPNAIGQSFNIGNPRSAVTIFDLAQRIKRLTGCPGEIVFAPLEYVDVELRIPNVEKAREDDRLRRDGRARRRPREDDRVVSKPETGTDVVRLARPDVGEEELAEIREVLESGQLTMGPKVAEFEALLADAAGTEHAVAVSSGTAALHVAVLALGIGPGDEVLVPAYTFPATANVVALVGATPVLVDVDPVTMNMDPADAARARHAADEGGARGASLRPARARSRSCPSCR